MTPVFTFRLRSWLTSLLDRSPFASRRRGEPKTVNGGLYLESRLAELSPVYKDHRFNFLRDHLGEENLHIIQNIARSNCLVASWETRDPRVADKEVMEEIQSMGSGRSHFTWRSYPSILQKDTMTGNLKHEARTQRSHMLDKVVG